MKILRGRNLDRFSAHVAIALADSLHHIIHADAVIDEFVGIDVDLILLHETADTGDFGHAFDGTKRIFQRPILQGPQLSKVVLTGIVNQSVFVNPADSSGVRPPKWG